MVNLQELKYNDRTELFDFSQALKLLKQGKRLMRMAWDKDGSRWVVLGESAKIEAAKFWNKYTKQYAEEQGGSAEVLRYFLQVEEYNGVQMGWQPTQVDMLAEDWTELYD